MSTKKISHNASQWGSLTALGTLVAAPLLSLPNTTEAAPVRYAQVRRQVVSLTGVVTRDLAGREFTMRSTDGRVFRVIIDAGREPRALSRNDRVTVSGYFASGLFIANSLTILNNRPAYNNGRPGYNTGRPAYNNGRPYYGGTTTGQRNTLTGVVTVDLAGREFAMRTGDGREIRVILDAGREPRALSRGDRVQVYGRFASGLFIANNLTILNDRPAYNGGTRPGSYPQGYPQGGYTRPGNGQVTFTGTVANVGSSTKLWVRANTGITYEVITSTPLNPAITVGDVVRVTGWGSAQSLQAGRVVLIRNIGR